MKKLVLALSMALALTLGLTACGGSSDAGSSGTGAGNQTDSWVIQETTDEFGDVTEDSTTYLGTAFTGTFSNTATTGSDFTGAMYIRWIFDNTHSYKDGGYYTVEFVMQEYGNTPFTYLDSDNSVQNKLKTKSSTGEKAEYMVWGTPPDGSILFMDGGVGGGDFIKSLVGESNEMRCVLSFSSTTFEFTLNGTGFADKFNELDALVSDAVNERKEEAAAAAKAEEEAAKAADEARRSHSDEEAIEKIHVETDDADEFAAAWFAAHVDDYQTLGQEEVEKLFPGTYAVLGARSTGTGLGRIYSFDEDGTYVDVAEWLGGDGYRQPVYKVKAKEYHVQDGKIVSFFGSSTPESHEVRKVAEDFYVLLDEDGELDYVMHPVDMNDIDL